MMTASEVVITCGGVGPTVDDVTIEGVAMAVGTHLSTHAAMAKSITSHFGDKVCSTQLTPGWHEPLLLMASLRVVHQLYVSAAWFVRVTRGVTNAVEALVRDACR
jgi:molybdopterin-biosynthesis enzyme MoeA-like protein